VVRLVCNGNLTFLFAMPTVLAGRVGFLFVLTSLTNRTVSRQALYRLLKSWDRGGDCAGQSATGEKKR
jgi:hypothetical protein